MAYFYFAYWGRHKGQEHRDNWDRLHRTEASRSSIYPLYEGYDDRSDDPWGPTGKLSKLITWFLATKEAQARAGGGEGHPQSIVCVGDARRLSLGDFLEQEENFLYKRLQVLLQRKRDIIEFHAPDGWHEEENSAMLRDERFFQLQLDERRYDRDRGQLTYLRHYSLMRDPNFTMQSWMMDRIKPIESVERFSFEYECFHAEHGGFYKPIAAFIWQVEGLELKDTRVNE